MNYENFDGDFIESQGFSEMLVHALSVLANHILKISSMRINLVFSLFLSHFALIKHSP